MLSYKSSVPQIRPISDLRTNLNEVCEQARESQEPVFMTKNGSASLVVIDSDAYARQQEHDRIYLKIKEAEIEARYNPETVPLHEVNQRLDEIFELMDQQYERN